MNPVDDALTAFLGGITAVDGTTLVKNKVRTGALDDWLEDRYNPTPIYVLTLGKVAGPMAWGLREASVPFTGIGVAPEGTRVPDVGAVVWHKGEHPVPGPGSQAAAQAVLAWVDALPVDARVLVLLSGGASSIMEAFEGDPARATDAWRADMAAGLPIDEVNARRAARSTIKGGRLGARMRERGLAVRVWLIADTPRDQARQTVGSAPFWQADGSIPHDVLASNRDLRSAAAAQLAALGWQVMQAPDRLSGDTEDAVAGFVGPIGPGAALVGGGETTVTLPDDAPPGGRCAHAALAASGRLASGQMFVALASDGVDGSTPEAGAWSGPEQGVDRAVADRDAYRHLDERGQTIRTGRLATNVNDIWVLFEGARDRQ